MHEMAERPLLIFISDIHLTDSLHGNAVSKGQSLASTFVNNN